jgi:citrate lyase gamma subunit
MTPGDVERIVLQTLADLLLESASVSMGDRSAVDTMSLFDAIRRRIEEMEEDVKP